MRNREFYTGYYKNKCLLLSLFLMAMLYTTNLIAEEQGFVVERNDAIELHDYINIALQQNPRIQAAKLAWAEHIEAYPQAVALADPVLTYSYGLEPIETRLGAQEHALQITQKLPFPGKRGLKGDVAKQDAEIARVQYEQTLNDVVAELKAVYYELYYLKKAIALTEKSQTILSQITQIGITDYASDVSSLNDVMKAQSQTGQMAYDLVLLKELAITERARFNALLNRHADNNIMIVDDLVLPTFPDPLHNLSFEHNDNLEIADLTLQKRQMQRQLSRYSDFPDFNVGVKYNQIADPDTTIDEAGRDAVSLILGVTIPLWRDKNNAIQQAAGLRYEQSLLNKQALNNTLSYQSKRYYFDLANAERLLKLYQNSLLPQAQTAMNTAQSFYQAGEASLAQFLETENTWLNFQLTYHRAEADYLKAYDALERLLGKSLAASETIATEQEVIEDATE